MEDENKPTVRVFRAPAQDSLETSTIKHGLGKEPGLVDSFRSVIHMRTVRLKNRAERPPSKSWEPIRSHESILSALCKLEILNASKSHLKFKDLIELPVDSSLQHALEEQRLREYKNYILCKSILSNNLSHELKFLINEIRSKKHENESNKQSWKGIIQASLSELRQGVNPARSLGWSVSNEKKGIEELSKFIEAEEERDLADQIEKKRQRIAELRAEKQRKLEETLEHQKQANSLWDEINSLKASIRESRSSKIQQKPSVEDQPGSSNSKSAMSTTPLEWNGSSKNLLDSKAFTQNN